MDASELFNICTELAAAPPGDKATRRLHEVVVLCAAEGCRQQGGAFGNLFSQIDFLGKHLHLSATLVRDIQTARRHTNTGTAIDTADWPYDLAAVTRFVAAVFHCDVPGTLLRLLPADRRRQPSHLTVNKSYVRCIVSDINDRYILAHTDDGTITIDYLNTESGRDFAYLRRVLRPDMQLNLLDCSVSDTVVVPGQVIVEPDFLIDISSLAACFTDYGHHPLLYTINRIKEKANTQAILLGNFAGMALDDIIHRPTVTTAQVLQRAFREQALLYCSCPDLQPEAFRQQAEQQMQNIREAVRLLAQHWQQTTPLLEPSFVCERLGLQGRVDLMTADMSLLVEQKAGKNTKIQYQSHDSHGLQLESHYVQLLLYYGVLRYNFGRTDRQVDTRLLYSRYPAAQGLLAVNYYRTLLREALRLRNQIVATDLLIAREGAGRILPLLRPDVVYRDVTADAYFHRYILPSLQRLQTQVSALSTIERAYLERMLTFVYREQVCQKLGSSETRLHHAGGCTSDLWLMPLQQKLEAGTIITGLTITGSERSPQSAGYDIITLQMADELTAATNFRRGDLVCLYQYDGDEPDVRHSILYKGSLQEIATDHIVVALNNAQQSAIVFQPSDSRRWAIEGDVTDVGTAAALRALFRLAGADGDRRDLLLSQRPPRADHSRRLTRHYHPDYDDMLQRLSQARDYFLLVGPPGTGKTSMALRFMVEEELAANTDAQVLLTAYTHRAVDEICAMLSEAALPYLRLGRPSSCDPRYRDHLLDTALATTRRLDDARALIDRTPVIVATTAMLQSQPHILSLKQFSLTIVDEASQILEPAIVGILASPAISRFVLVGDHKQLPAVTQQSPEQAAVSEQCLIDIGLDDCRQSLFQRLLRWEHSQQRSLFVATLQHHGRMHPDVARFPLHHFYQREQLTAVPLPHQQETSLHYALPPRDDLDSLLASRRRLFLPVTASGTRSEEQSLLLEARIVADVVQRLYRFTTPHFDPARTLGIIVPYRRQIALIRQALSDSGIDILQQVSIDTVERYQGSQRDIIIYSLAVTRRFQLDFLTATSFVDDDGTLIDRKLNVALTRARRQMIVVGRQDIMRHAPLLQQLLNDFA